MISIATRRSLVFHLWVRLTAVTAVFTLLAIGVFVWLEIDDSLKTAREHSGAQAVAAARAQTNAIQVNAARNTTGLPFDRTRDVGEALGIAGVQFLNSDGTVVRTAGTLDMADAEAPAATLDGVVQTGAYDIQLEDGGFTPVSINPVSLLQGGDYGAVHVLETPQPRDGVASPAGQPEFIRVVMRYDGLSGEAQTLLLRSLALAGGILAVAALTIWGLLHRFVSRPLQAYNTTARSIANGESARMPDLGTHEFAELGQTIDDMAAALRHQASIDALTGLFNVRDLRNRLPSLLDDAMRDDQPLAVLVCDLDNMKPVNDTYGHLAGDLVLRAVAEGMRSWAPEDTVCWRTGGDEFAAVMPGTPPAAARALARELATAICSTAVPVPGGGIEVGLSLGVACFPDDGSTVQALLNTADRRMYESKAGKVRAGAAGAA